MATIMDTLTRETYHQYRLSSPSTNHALIFVFSSIARTNLKLGGLGHQRWNFDHGGADGASASALSNTTKTKSCFLPLLHVLTIHKKLMSLNVKLIVCDWCQDYVGEISANQSAPFSHVTFSRPIRSEYLERLRE